MFQVYSWGCNDDFALGRETPNEEDSAVPGLVNIEEKIVQITAGDSHSAALTESGNVYAWGSFRVRLETCFIKWLLHSLNGPYFIGFAWSYGADSRG